ncbi:phosphatidylinositol phosphate synthase [Pseudactinotalea suaedae]|uniref:phosphatidylinositol phosphate synthase n=1 Tax=Pseudactinotalea suaedae TaxID=1524924 RepID=UPI0012E13DF0|nr:CDP-alcohol phosphatidyltransferase family protein [Pseudactinotalea suaedae]
MVLGNRGRGVSSALFGPLARLLVRLKVSPDVVTFAGTLAVIAASLTLLPTAHLTVGALVLGVFVLTDSIDGIMARLVHGEEPRPYGEFLDSTLDRFSDGAIFAGLTLYFVGHTTGSTQTWGVATAVACLALGGLVSYARAKAQALGVVAKVGIAERADRLIVALAATLLVGLGLPVLVLVVALALLAAASLVTVGQRMVLVRRALVDGRTA